MEANALLNRCLPDWLHRELKSHTPVPMLAVREARTVDLSLIVLERNFQQIEVGILLLSGASLVILIFR